ncbi:hypothetical protein TI05_14515 [Achromatium sp. WMS3]|nr:hypothetical protein TI05_14515 [Achromatium sp. WMS3]
MNIGGTLTLVNTGIATSAQSGAAGNIYIDPPAIKITNSRITTSGSSGGNIDIRGVDSNSTLSLNGSLIQANASDGNVYINMVTVDNVTVGNPADHVTFLNGTQGDNVTIGDTSRMTFASNSNQIQAGTNGTVTLVGGTSSYYHVPDKHVPDEDTKPIDENTTNEEETTYIELNQGQSTRRMLPNPCEVKRNLKVMGRGGLPTGELDSALSDTPKTQSTSKTGTKRDKKKHRRYATQSSVCSG